MHHVYHQKMNKVKYNYFKYNYLCAIATAYFKLVSQTSLVK